MEDEKHWGICLRRLDAGVKIKTRKVSMWTTCSLSGFYWGFIGCLFGFYLVSIGFIIVVCWVDGNGTVALESHSSFLRFAIVVSTSSALTRTEQTCIRRDIHWRYLNGIGDWLEMHWLLNIIKEYRRQVVRYEKPLNSLKNEGSDRASWLPRASTDSLWDGIRSRGSCDWANKL